MNARHIKLAAYAVITVAVVEDIVVDQINKRRFKRNLEVAQTLVAENVLLQAQLKTTEDQMNYLLNLVNREGVTLTEFDRIALDNLNFRVKVK
jgi:hypothetical protein